MQRAFQVPNFMFALRGTHQDFTAAEQALGIPPHTRPTPLGNGEELHFYREPRLSNDRWPTTGQLRMFNIKVYASTEFITWEDNQS